MATAHPSPADAVRLLDALQRLLRDSSYTTTYKFALLHTFCDLSLEMGPGESTLPLANVAERVIELYWEQVRPFSGLVIPGMVQLSQTTGETARIIARVEEMSKANAGALSDARKHGRLRTYSLDIVGDLKRYPLDLLQRPDDQFLYHWPAENSELRFLPGVIPTLQQFHGLLTDMIQVRWTAWVERNNKLEGSDALRAHLFGEERESLRAVVPAMLEIQGNRCFYTGDALAEGETEVDHFLPWSLTHNNSVGNLVLATESYNNKKSNKLPSSDEKKTWELRNEKFAEQLETLAAETGLGWNPVALKHLAAWAFSQAS